MAATGIPISIPALASSGTVASTYKVYAWVPDSSGAPTATPRSLYTDAACTTPASNPATLGASTRKLYKKASQAVVVEVKSSDDATTYDTVHYPAVLITADALDDLGAIRVCATYAEMTALTSDLLTDNCVVYTYGRAAEEDGGAGHWRYDATSTATANSGTILAIDGGGAGRFFRLYDSGEVRAEWFGSLSSSFAATLALAITAAGTGGTVIIPKGSYSMTAGVTLLAKQTLVFEGAPEFTEDYVTGADKVSRAFNGTAFNMDAAGCGIEGLNFDGVGATYTGAAIRIAGGQQQWLEGCNIDDSADECLLFVGADAGERFVAHACHFRRTTATNPAIVLPTTIDTAGNRSFLDCDSFGGCLARFNKSINTHIHNGRFANLDFAGSTSVGGDLRCTITGCRIASGGTALTLEGSGGVITGCVLAGNITLGTSSSRWHVGPNAMPGFTITDNSTATGDNVNEVFGAAQVAITPTFKADSVDPAKGNGTLTGRVARNGRILKVDIQFTAGSTSTFGTGDWYFTLPSPFAGFVSKADAVGSVRILDSGTQYYEGTCVVAAGSGRIYLYMTQTVNATSPMTWATNDTLKLTIEFEVS